MSVKLKTAFYYKRSTDKNWTLHGVFDTAESAWVAALELPHKDVDLWFPTLPPGEPVDTEMTPKQFKNFKVRRLTPA